MAALPPVVPFVRVLVPGTSGRDVIAVKRALSRAGFMEWGEFTPVWGPFAQAALKAFEKTLGYKQTGVYAYTRHEALRKRHKKGSRIEWAFDAFSIAILRQEDVTPYEATVERVVSAVDQAILRRDVIPYTQARPFPDILPYPNIPNLGADCSGFVTWALRSGGPHVPDPNGTVGGSTWKWGFTGTLWARNAVVSRLSLAKVCDLVFYGRPWESGSAAHVAIVRAIEGGVVYVGSHGSSRGPLNVQATYRSITGIRRPVLIP
jgi:cell wall-associated NlpC family hydrolase